MWWVYLTLSLSDVIPSDKFDSNCFLIKPIGDNTWHKRDKKEGPLQVGLPCRWLFLPVFT